MKMKPFMIAALLSFVCFFNINAQEYNLISIERTKPYWQDVNVVKVNKEYPRTQFMTFENKSVAINSKFEDSKYYISLNGTWKFYFVDGYKQLPENVTDSTVSLEDWSDIKVPGNWEVQ